MWERVVHIKLISLFFNISPLSLPLSLFPLFPQIGSLEPKPRRDILMTDFEVVETVEFPA